MPSSGFPKRICFFCLGNICRSPLAEGVFRKLLREGQGKEGALGRLAQAYAKGLLEIDSAGTGGWHAGEPPDPRSIQEAKRQGEDISSQRARQLTAEDFAQFDWLIAMDESNLREAAKRRPKGSRFERAQLLPFASFWQGEEARYPLGVPDPYYGGPEGFREVWDLLVAGMHALMEEMDVDMRDLASDGGP